ncbi:N19M, NADH-ubiquinone oxidoreductase 9.5 kDa subunit [Conidiobolus coronatus NRRL 28638]|uniref:N19M, NADH-ubiquinone oxidoreductase 9.5 kDa subunit n=1 Tax=Conidiobolus coronatus (strain ATCC 28846 / CBS 209.66 / NRRL 28638) TaxID=796925 RepID=A0A137NQN2_CONC2|nr:N19M, NADH-ubiquinone oxidoreductase 9.5 kDa subunit [Conidiobolus coronatus NRRL 28638]|eukprot:KXN65051.1 N19M, NADH-ubiquinone oxidoreductase 9.5 kDa subunit [Conidiobolus coronatus NRRL 28638]
MIRAIKYYALEYPVYFWSLTIGAFGPPTAYFVPKWRGKLFGNPPSKAIPTTYPLPNRARQSISGYED